MKLNDLFEIYIKDVDLTHQETTLDTMRYRYNSLIKDEFGDYEMDNIDFKDIKQFQKDLVRGKIRTKDNKVFSVTYVNGIVQLLKRLLRYASLMNYVEFTQEQSRGLKSICNIPDKEKYKKKQIVWKISDFNIFIKSVDEKKYEALFNVLFYAGLRKGEVLSLCWRDVDLIDQTITVTSTACRVKGKGQLIKEPKSKCSYRVVHINDSLNELLLNLYLNEKDKYKTNISHRFVFGSHKMIAYSTLDRKFKKFKSLSGVSDMNLHGFRHSHATMMLELTNDVYNVSKRLGHESIEITDTYLHVNAKIQKDMAEQIEKAIKDEKKSTYGAFLKKLKKDLKKEMTTGNYSKKELNNIKKIYECVRDSM